MWHLQGLSPPSLYIHIYIYIYFCTTHLTLLQDFLQKTLILRRGTLEPFTSQCPRFLPAWWRFFSAGSPWYSQLRCVLRGTKKPRGRGSKAEPPCEYLQLMPSLSLSLYLPLSLPLSVVLCKYIYIYVCMICLRCLYLCTYTQINLSLVCMLPSNP